MIVGWWYRFGGGGEREGEAGWTVKVARPAGLKSDPFVAL